MKEIRETIWSKLLTNMSMSVLCLLTGQTARAVRDDPALADVVPRLLDEAGSVAQSAFPEVKRVTRSGPAPDHKPSILQDYELGRAMEIDVLVRAPAAFARAAGLSTPMLDFLARAGDPPGARQGALSGLTPAAAPRRYSARTTFRRQTGSGTSTNDDRMSRKAWQMKKAKNAVQPGAPALEKGLDLLEALAAEARGLSQKQLAVRVGRSVGEIFRMLVALERRGYVTRDPVTGEYTLTLKLFRIASQFPPTERLLQAALPVMEQLAGRVQLSCHLTVLHGEQFMVIARIEPEWLMGWSVKVGAVFPLTQQYASAKVLAAFQLESRRQELADVIAAQDRISGKKALAALDRISAEGGNFSNDDGYTRILAYSCPIVEASGRAVAALTVPLVRQDKIPAQEAAAIASELRKAAKTVSEKIGASAVG